MQALCTPPPHCSVEAFSVSITGARNAGGSEDRRTGGVGDNPELLPEPSWPQGLGPNRHFPVMRATAPQLPEGGGSLGSLTATPCGAGLVLGTSSRPARTTKNRAQPCGSTPGASAHARGYRPCVPDIHLPRHHGFLPISATWRGCPSPLHAVGRKRGSPQAASPPRPATWVPASLCADSPLQGLDGLSCPLSLG